MIKNRPLIIFLCLILVNTLKGQIDISPFEYHELMSIDTLEYNIESQTIRESRIARNYTFLGEYLKSDSLSPIVFPDRFDSLSKKDLAYLSQFDPVNPFPLIDSLSKMHSVILINENHAYPSHRIFFHNLLDELSENGYSLIGMETLTTNYKHISRIDSVPYNLNDTVLNVRGYPLYPGFKGTYIKEPQMAIVFVEEQGWGIHFLDMNN